MNLCEISIDPNHTILFNEAGNISTVMPDLFTLSNEVEVASPRGNYDRSVVDEVWEAAEVIPGNDSGLWRKDKDGNMICRSEYGNPRSSFGWEVYEEFGQPDLKALHIDSF